MKKIIVYTDGGSRGNPGPSAIGVLFCNQKGEIIKSYSQYLGDNLTNNEAEYQAVIFALQKLKLLFGRKLAKMTEVELRSDSELLIKQLTGQYKILEPNIQSLFLKIWNLKTDFKKVQFKKVKRSQNTKADQLVNEILSTKTSKKLF
jgi:ribonuclease HI